MNISCLLGIFIFSLWNEKCINARGFEYLRCLRVWKASRLVVGVWRVVLEHERMRLGLFSVARAPEHAAESELRISASGSRAERTLRCVRNHALLSLSRREEIPTVHKSWCKQESDASYKTRRPRFSRSQFSLSGYAFLCAVKGFEKSASLSHQEKFQRAPSILIARKSFRLLGGWFWCCFYLFMGRSRRPLETICHLAAVKCSPLPQCEPVNLIKMVNNLWARPSRGTPLAGWKPTRRADTETVQARGDDAFVTSLLSPFLVAHK